MSTTPFYASGLRFSCARCSACCRHESGFVFLSKADLTRLATECQMEYTAFMQTYCRWVSRWDSGQGRECLSLKEKSNFDCIFWDKGCTVYHARPVQCRTFPFWPVVLESPESWKIAASGCPGINAGELRCRKEIEQHLEQERAAQADLIYSDTFIAGVTAAAGRR